MWLRTCIAAEMNRTDRDCLSKRRCLGRCRPGHFHSSINCMTIKSPLYMLINFKQSIAKHNLKITGIIHVGAHYGQEDKEYAAAGIRNITFFEPCHKAFSVLKSTLSEIEGVNLYNLGCGSKEGTFTMNVEQANQGMSNSLLRPAKHLQQYPSIQFVDEEQVNIVPLDKITQARPKHLYEFNLDT